MGSLLCFKKSNNVVEKYSRVDEARVLDKSKDGEYQDKTMNNMCVCEERERKKEK
jgi:hypothetical protein